MEEISFEYLNKLANQIIVIGSLLGGFSIAVIANFLVSDLNTRLSNNIMKASVLSASLFLVSVFAMTKVLMTTTDGFPLKVTTGDIKTASTIGGITLLLGILSLIAIIAMAGWSKTKQMGRFTTIVGILTFILILIMLT
jgi:DMSO/TMAO reductase YedYZ heme-binding membrane subunit